MTRSEQREQAFVLVFEQIFNDCSVEELIENAQMAEEIMVCDFARQSAENVMAHLEEIDQAIEASAIGWQKRRFSKVALAILRLATYELLFVEEIPVGVSINEAIELAKKYATSEDASFVNGVLGGIVRATQKKAEK